MPTSMSRLLSQLSRKDLERLLATKAEVETLEARRAELQKELDDIDKKLAKLADAAEGAQRGTYQDTVGDLRLAVTELRATVHALFPPDFLPTGTCGVARDGSIIGLRRRRGSAGGSRCESSTSALFRSVV